MPLRHTRQVGDKDAKRLECAVFRRFLNLPQGEKRQRRNTAHSKRFARFGSRYAGQETCIRGNATARHGAHAAFLRSLPLLAIIFFPLCVPLGLHAQQRAASPANLFEAGNLAYKTSEYRSGHCCLQGFGKAGSCLGNTSKSRAGRMATRAGGHCHIGLGAIPLAGCFQSRRAWKFAVRAKTAQVEAPELACTEWSRPGCRCTHGPGSER